MWGLGWLLASLSRIFSKRTPDHSSSLADNSPEVSTTRHHQQGTLFFQSSINATGAARVSLPNRPQQNSPLLRLPAELRISIYSLLLQDIFHHIVAGAKLPSEHVPVPTDKPQPPMPPLLGFLALAHTSHTLRAESVHFLKAHALPGVKTLMAAATSFHATLTPDSSVQDVDECAARCRAVSEGYHLLDVLTVFSYSQLCLDRPSSHLPWSQLGLGQKRLVAIGWLLGLPHCEQQSIQEVLAGSEDRCGLLVRAIDLRLEADKREQENFCE